jgi:hypothetical protein
MLRTDPLIPAPVSSPGSWSRSAEALIFVLITCLTRYLLRSRFLYDVDSVNFALALSRFDPAAHQPQPPGYFLYICLGRLVNSLAHDANGALVAISIAASCGAVATIYLLTREWFGSKAARCAAALFVFSPLAWFHGIVALTYIVETFFSALTGYLCWKRSWRAAAVVLGLASGVRPSSLLFLAPLYFFSLRKASWRLRFTGVAILASVVFAWFIPLVHGSGGLTAWASSLLSLWNTVPGKETVFNSSIANSVARLLSIVLIYGLCFGCAAILPVLRRHSGLRAFSASPARPLFIFACVWIAPGLLFFTFVFLRFTNSGYLLFLSPPVFAWLGLIASEWYTSGRRLLVWACLPLNVLIFLRAPVYCSYNEVQKFERELGDVLALLPAVASPHETMILGFDSHFMGYRHAGYYLPDYVTVEYPAVRLASGPRIFTMRHRDTRLAAGLAGGYKTFIIFPLPREGSGYRDYMAGIKSRFASSDLLDRSSQGRTFITGPISALATVFHADR